MLQLFRAKKEWLKWVLVLVIFGLGFTTVLLFVRTPNTGIMGGVGVQEVARIAGQTITAAQFRRHYQQVYEYYSKLYKLDKQDPVIVRQLGLGQQALSQIVNQYTIAAEARLSGLAVTDAELIEAISRFPVFQEDGRFIGSERYRQILQYSGMTTQEFEESMRRDILSEKFRNVITDGVQATEAEIRQDFEEANLTVKVDYVVFDPEEVKVEEISDEQLQTYYEENQQTFQEPERRKIKFVEVFVNPDEVEVTEQQVEAAVSSVASEEQVRARHILINLDEGEEAARRKADRILREVRNGGDFQALAREHSADETSALRGGDLGYFARGRMVPEFEVAAFGLEPGQVSDLVRTPFGFHIIKMIARTNSDEESLHSAAEFQARLEEAEAKSSELARQVVRTAREAGGLDQAGVDYSLNVSTSEYFDSTSGIPGLGVAADFVQEVFALSQEEVTEPYSVGGVYVVAQLEDIKPSRVPGLEEIRAEVAEDFAESRKRQLAEESASRFRQEALEAEDFESVAKNHRLKVTHTDFFKKGANIDENLRFSPNVHGEAFALDPGGVSSPIVVADKYIVFQVAERGAVDEEKFKEEEAQISERLTEQKKNEFFSAYMENAVAELRRNEQIVINQQLVDDIVGL
jgi:peptidyl-prolyl cis-trans isomerase D